MYSTYSTIGCFEAFNTIGSNKPKKSVFIIVLVINMELNKIIFSILVFLS